MIGFVIYTIFILMKCILFLNSWKDGSLEKLSDVF